MDPKAVLTRVKIFKVLLHVLKKHKNSKCHQIQFPYNVVVTVKICCMILAPGVFVIILPVYFTEKLNQVIIVH